MLIETSLGNIKVELAEDKAPVTVKNFLSYADDKHYDNTIFHRVIGKENTPDQHDFMIQGGGFDKDMNQKKTKEPIKNESSNGLSNVKYTIAMARTGDPNIATSQFYINVGDNTFLDKAIARDGVGYCVFGKVIEGNDVVDKIKAVPTGVKGGMPNVPVEPVIIKTIKRVTTP